MLMNSFSTSEDTKAFLSARHADLLAEDDVELVQNKSPKIDAKTLEPATYPPHPEQEWCAAGGALSTWAGAEPSPGSTALAFATAHSK